jgi:hypothetical protein
MAHTLFDENFGGEHGNCHVAVGASYADTYAGDPAELTESERKSWASTTRPCTGTWSTPNPKK